MDTQRPSSISPTCTARVEACRRTAARPSPWYRKAADQGHTGAQTNLGAAYEAGLGVERDFAQAADWYRKAADHGNAVAQYNLGNLYGSGRGVPQDYRQAMAWYRKAAAQDHALAETSLGYAYDVGRGVPQDVVQADRWIVLAIQRYAASDKGKHEKAVQARKNIESRMTPAQIEQAQKLVREWKPGVQ